ncbi:hypothetical protein [Mycolicibacterium aichiense]|uniref:Uncharacterized protein n=1 Tax=Mycolicibacterium aichiense TaxID=1799 RepID=A0A378VAG5_9MYCO|nr:hypothetical protein [Mycolicibacterium aichiense]QFG08015.1 hypothetical protein SEA_HERBERTWM_46 [Mycobacterium phage Herbertwm]MCV7016775.1 hypothetical protein [Mycolicibacterium aichiense]SUA14007.1 Uncharacterised protein [Mycolicibacterium aichiense]SUA14415.1 Uncharacterised protein [Mycolicibacterium aichiense]BBX09442.1 hypothetical protein MAIC_42450 [Mycolicibacterium aichiense]
MKMYAIYDHDGVLNLYSKREVWQWLKAEKRWHVLDKRRKRQEGVPHAVLVMRRMGKPETPVRYNRAYRRSLRRKFA